MTTGRINQVAAFWCTPAFEQARPQAAPYPDGLRQPECLRHYSQDRPACSAARHRRPALSVFREAPLKHSSGTRPTIPKLSAAPWDGTGFAQVRPRRKLTSIEELHSEEEFYRPWQSLHGLIIMLHIVYQYKLPIVRWRLARSRAPARPPAIACWRRALTERRGFRGQPPQKRPSNNQPIFTATHTTRRMGEAYLRELGSQRSRQHPPSETARPERLASGLSEPPTRAVRFRLLPRQSTGGIASSLYVKLTASGGALAQDSRFTSALFPHGPGPHSIHPPNRAAPGLLGPHALR